MKLTSENRSAMQEEIGRSESTAKSAEAEAPRAASAKASAGEAQHSREVGGANKAHQPIDRKAAYADVRAKMERGMSPVLNRKEAVARQKQDEEQEKKNQSGDKRQEEKPVHRPAPSRDWDPFR